MSANWSKPIASPIRPALNGVDLEWNALQKERDPEMYAAGLLSLAGRLEQRDKGELAAKVYAEVLRGNNFPTTSRRARQRLDALQGVGTLGPAFEVWLNSLTRQVLDPATLFGFCAASAAFRLTLLLGLSHFSAVGAEALTLTLATRWAGGAKGTKTDWSEGRIASEIGLGLLLLGTLRGMSVKSGRNRVTMGPPRMGGRPQVRSLLVLESRSREIKTAGLLHIRGTGDLQKISPELREALHTADLFHLLKQTRWDRPYFEIAALRLAHALQHSDPLGARGSYANNLIREVFWGIHSRKDVRALEGILRLLGKGGRVRALEGKFAGELPNLIGRDRPLAGRSILQGKRTLDISFPELSREILELRRSRPLFLLEMEKIFREAGRSPLALFRIRHLHRLLQSPNELTLLKLRELADPHLRWAPEEPIPFTANTVLPRQGDAYLGAGAPGDILKRAREGLGNLRDEGKAKHREETRRKILGELFRDRGWGFDRKNLIEAFRRLGDPFSLQVARSIGEGEYEVWVLDREKFQKALQAIPQAHSPQPNQNALYLRGLPYLRKGGLMLIRELPLDLYSPKTAPDAYFLVLSKIVHEHQHHVDFLSAKPNAQHLLFYQELSAHLSEALWRAEHGDLSKLKTHFLAGGGGMALNFRDVFEWAYEGKNPGFMAIDPKL